MLRRAAGLLTIAMAQLVGLDGLMDAGPAGLALLLGEPITIGPAMKPFGQQPREAGRIDQP